MSIRYNPKSALRNLVSNLAPKLSPFVRKYSVSAATSSFKLSGSAHTFMRRILDTGSGHVRALFPPSRASNIPAVMPESTRIDFQKKDTDPKLQLKKELEEIVDNNANQPLLLELLANTKTYHVFNAQRMPSTIAFLSSLHNYLKRQSPDRPVKVLVNGYGVFTQEIVYLLNMGAQVKAREELGSFSDNTSRRMMTDEFKLPFDRAIQSGQLCVEDYRTQLEGEYDLIIWPNPNNVEGPTMRSGLRRGGLLLLQTDLDFMLKRMLFETDLQPLFARRYQSEWESILMTFQVGYNDLVLFENVGLVDSES